MTDAVELAAEITAARARLIEFVTRCTPDTWASCPLAEDDPRTVGVIVDHVADAYEYLRSWVSDLAHGDTIEVSPEIVDELNSRHAGIVVAPAPDATVDHLVRSGDALVALIESMDAEQLLRGDGRVTVARLAEIAARHADSHRVELEAALWP